MMRTKITRKLIETTITGHILDYRNGEPIIRELDTITVYGNVTEKEALKALKQVYGKKAGITVGKIESVENQYEVGIADFIKIATKI